MLDESLEELILCAHFPFSASWCWFPALGNTKIVCSLKLSPLLAEKVVGIESRWNARCTPDFFPSQFWVILQMAGIPFHYQYFKELIFGRRFNPYITVYGLPESGNQHKTFIPRYQTNMVNTKPSDILLQSKSESLNLMAQSQLG